MATTLAQSVAGTTFAISSALPATEASASYVALAYTLVGEVVDLGTLGKTYSTVMHNPLASRQTFKFKTSYDSGSITVQLAKAINDAGQAMMLTGLDSDSDYSFRITTQDQRDSYFRAKITSFTTKIGAVGNILGADVIIAITSDIFETA